jgi:uncharacterized protein YjbI with pentapeptide repeats
MSEQDSSQLSSPQQPATNDPTLWKAYWEKLDQPWRTEPEIDKNRQEELAKRLDSIDPDILRGIYPFKNIEPKLNRADLEWLLVTHENGRGPVDWGDESQRGRKGLDLRGADLCHLDLRNLPLARMCGGLLWEEWLSANEEPSDMAAVSLEEADLSNADLQGAILTGACLKGVVLKEAHLEEADLREANLREAILSRAHLEKADLEDAHLEGAYLFRAYLAEADLSGTHLMEARLDRANLCSEKHIGPWLADIYWNNVNLAVVDWSQVKVLADEHEAEQKKSDDDNMKDRSTRFNEYMIAARANRQLAIALQSQGLNEDAAPFAFGAEKLQRKVFWFQMIGQHVKIKQRIQSLGKWLFSWFLNLFTGYGFKPGRWLIVYLGTITVFAVLHYFVVKPHPTVFNAIVMSVLNLHGRPFLNSPSGLEGGINIVEAFFGLVVEAVLIAIITERIFLRK